MLKYFSNDEQYINAECEKCERVMKIPRNHCALTPSGLVLSPSILCKCGTKHTIIGNLPNDYNHQYVANVVPENLTNLSSEEILAKSLINEYAASLRMRDWEDSNLDTILPWRRETMRKIVNIGEPAVDRLIELLSDSDWAIRDDAAIMLGHIKSKKAIQPLQMAIQNDDSRAVRLSAQSALKRIGIS